MVGFFEPRPFRECCLRGLPDFLGDFDFPTESPSLRPLPDRVYSRGYRFRFTHAMIAHQRFRCILYVRGELLLLRHFLRRGMPETVSA